MYTILYYSAGKGNPHPHGQRGDGLAMDFEASYHLARSVVNPRKLAREADTGRVGAGWLSAGLAVADRPVPADSRCGGFVCTKAAERKGRD